jgi:hypothetical protein
MKKIIRYLVKKICVTFLDDCYIIITCSKQVDAQSQPIRWQISTNLAMVSDARIVSGWALSKLDTDTKQRDAIEEVNNILNKKK